MNLGDKLGLFSRTILVPAARTLYSSRDQTRYDAARTLRTMLYVRPKDLPMEEFHLIFAAATGESSPSLVSVVLGQLFGMSIVIIFCMLSLGSGIPWVARICFGAAAMIGAMQIARNCGRTPPIPAESDATNVLMAWLGAGRCPACGYKLEPARSSLGDPDDTARLRCNECGALWHRIPPIARRP